MIVHLIVLAVLSTRQVDNCLDIARFYFHHNSNAYLTMNIILFQLAA